MYAAASTAAAGQLDASIETTDLQSRGHKQVATQEFAHNLALVINGQSLAAFMQSRKV